MNKLTWLILFGFGLTGSVYGTPRAGAAPNILVYAEASALVAWGGDIDPTPGAAVAAGVTAYDVHSLEVNIMRFKEDFYWHDLVFTPMLVAYRHTFQLHRLASLDLGAGLGATLENSSGRGAAWAFTTGLMTALSVRLTPRSTLEAKAWLLNLEDTRYGGGRVGVFTLGVNVVL